MLEDIMKTLDRIPLWKRLSVVPGEVDDLEARVADLEDKLGGKWPADVCKFCGERAVRLSATLGPDKNGKIRQHWTCAECEKLEVRLI